MGLKELFIKLAIKRQVAKLKKEKPEMFKFLEGKKTYIIAIVTGILAGLQAYGFAIPEYVYAVLAALGLGALRAGIDKK